MAALQARERALARGGWCAVVTGELKSKIDAVWNSFWSGGISNPLEVMEQLTYLLFIKALDERQTLAENKANRTAERHHRAGPGLRLAVHGRRSRRPRGDLRRS